MLRRTSSPIASVRPIQSFSTNPEHQWETRPRGWAEPADLEPALWGKLAKPVDRRRRHEMDGRQVEERARRHVLVSQVVAMSQTLEIRPVFLQRRRVGREATTRTSRPNSAESRASTPA